MMLLREIMIWIIQAVLFGIGIGIAGLTAHLAGPLLATAFAIDELIPTAVVFFAVAAGLGWIGNRFWPEDWMHDAQSPALAPRVRYRAIASAR
jgi:hypothetical protein